MSMRGSPEVRRLAAGTLMPGFVGTTVPDWVRRARDEGVGALALYGSNVSDPGGLEPVLGQLRGLGPLLLHHPCHSSQRQPQQARHGGQQNRPQIIAMPPLTCRVEPVT